MNEALAKLSSRVNFRIDLKILSKLGNYSNLEEALASESIHILKQKNTFFKIFFLNFKIDNRWCKLLDLNLDLKSNLSPFWLKLKAP